MKLLPKFLIDRLSRNENEALVNLEEIRNMRHETNAKLTGMAASLGKDEKWFRVMTEEKEGAPVCACTEANHST